MIRNALKSIFFTLHPGGKIKEIKVRGLILMILLPAVILASLAIWLEPKDVVKAKTIKSAKDERRQQEELQNAAVLQQQMSQFFLDQQQNAMGK
ncbi:MAG: hypothetical protein JWO73_555 [Candidatus Taylorbacteria bacterium]|nr:hypothetical protein [Candidatus Taylorbacteria bacterium]